MYSEYDLSLIDFMMGKCLSMCSSKSSINTTKSISQSVESAQTVDVNEATEKKTKSYPPSLKDVDIPRTYALKDDYDESKIQTLFERYKDESEDSILVSGMERLCQDLGVNPTEFSVLALAWKFKASKMCRFTRKEFVEGCRLLKVDNLNAMKYSMADMEKEVRQRREDFRELYRFTFGFGLDVEDGQRNLPTNMAIPLWRLVFGDDAPTYMDKWCQYLEDNGVKVIPRDTWNMFLHLVESMKPDFSNYDESEAWPSLFDDFVEAHRTNMPNIDGTTPD
ncbi:DCN1-like protein 3 [Xenia sp. Carnegie-2017]|uniref:DCN1-like protein 3 n=1 Tax=Xenia sp. Carnegie-2017 TaxID=2897299 RepID=UPI001F03A132|nr:DCN1-like protein 3 [Xenia sp. Carnegie-2017]